MPANKDRQRRRQQHAKLTAKKRSPGQKAAWRDLAGLAERNPFVVEVKDLHAAKGELCVRVRLATGHLATVEGGLPVSPVHEDVILVFTGAYPDRPPAVVVQHARFVGHPHVLAGSQLCIYLDEDREWHPSLGADAVVARLLEWFEDAAASRFDSRTALFHPIGGLPPSPSVGAVLVVRQPQPPGRRPLSIATVDVRAAHRDDLIRWDGPPRDGDPPSVTGALVVRTAEPIPHGLVNVDVLGAAFARVQQAGGPTLEDAAAAIGAALPYITDGWLRVIIDVAHPDDQDLSYLACVLTPAPDPATTSPNALLNQQIRWLTMHDERPTVATRRDHKRPTAAFHGQSVEIWGCGGIGSWIAEFIARAGAARITLCDLRPVGPGLLVRQNYTEDDVGLGKADRLAVRLRSIRDDFEVATESANVLEVLNDGFTITADILIDATINVTVAARLDEWAYNTTDAPLMAQVATDPRTATLGMLVVAADDSHRGPATVDDATWRAIRDMPDLERFHGFWTTLDKSDQLVPGLGCSTPTFHGSAADLASLAGSLVSLLGGHVGVGASGTHLIESSHAQGPGDTGHRFIPYPGP